MRERERKRWREERKGESGKEKELEGKVWEKESDNEGWVQEREWERESTLPLHIFNNQIRVQKKKAKSKISFESPIVCFVAANFWSCQDKTHRSRGFWASQVSNLKCFKFRWIFTIIFTEYYKCLLLWLSPTISSCASAATIMVCVWCCTLIKVR